MKLAHLLFLATLLPSCQSQHQSNQEDVQWYKDQIIEQVQFDSDTSMRVQIGIHAQSFYIDRRNKEFKDQRYLLQESLTKRQKLNISVAKGTSNIVHIQKANNAF